jgi:hypothetical protein
LSFQRIGRSEHPGSEDDDDELKRWAGTTRASPFGLHAV